LKSSNNKTSKTCNSNNNNITNRSRSAESNNNNNNYRHSPPSSSSHHFKLNLGEIPFVVGKSTTPSHHLGTNIQNVFSLLKQHHPKLCCKFNSTCNSAKSNSINQISKSVSTNGNSYISSNRRSRCSAGLDNHIEDLVLKQQQTPKRSKSTPLVNNNEINEKAIKTTSKISKESKMNSKETIPNDSNSNDLMSNVDWNELLRILQEEYTKLVL